MINKLDSHMHINEQCTCYYYLWIYLHAGPYYKHPHYKGVTYHSTNHRPHNFRWKNAATYFLLIITCPVLVKRCKKWLCQLPRPSVPNSIEACKCPSDEALWIIYRVWLCDTNVQWFTKVLVILVTNPLQGMMIPWMLNCIKKHIRERCSLYI